VSEEPAERGERVAKLIARAGLCSRREAEQWIADGRVAVAGKRIATPAALVADPATIRVDGKPLALAERPRLWRYHKPRGLICTHRDPAGRPTVFDRLPPDLPRVVSIGRLDLASEGLLLLTNDGALARKLEHPANGWVRRYRVRAFGAIDDAAIAALGAGITVEGVRYGPIRLAIDRRQGDNIWLTVSLAEGKNREVRRALDHVGLTVNRLIRLAYGPFQLGQLPKNAVAEVPGKVLAEQLGAPRPAPLRPRPSRGHADAHRRR